MGQLVPRRSISLLSGRAETAQFAQLTAPPVVFFEICSPSDPET
jgi:hypothetical protein